MKRRKICERFYCGWAMACVAFFFCAEGTIPSSAQTFNTLISFDGTNGASPSSPLVQGANGDYYGTTSTGGANGGGTVFEITPEGSLTTLHNFCAQANCSDGSGPGGTLVQTSNGTFWGITGGGGANGYGTIFKMSPRGALITVHSFNNNDGAFPVGLMQASDGNFYGTTFSRGSQQDSGTVFKVTPGGKLTTLHAFCVNSNCRDGQGPLAGLVEASDGNFYGTTTAGGLGAGVIFKITAGGKLTVVRKLGALDGCYPSSTLVQAIDGNLYGTASECGDNNGGTFFKVTLGGTFTTLYAFCSQPNCADGRGPAGTFLQATDGNFYGTTDGGLGDSDSTAFEIAAGGGVTTLYTFDNPGNVDPSGLVQATNGTLYQAAEKVLGHIDGPQHIAIESHPDPNMLKRNQAEKTFSAACYGATYSGGSDNDGMIYSLSVGLGPFAETLPTSGKVGSTVLILGNNLTGTTSVSFNGTPATFTVENNTEINTHVPVGASTGYVTVLTPTGLLNSNVKFQVRQ